MLRMLVLVVSLALPVLAAGADKTITVFKDPG